MGLCLCLWVGAGVCYVLVGVVCGWLFFIFLKCFLLLSLLLPVLCFTFFYACYVSLLLCAALCNEMCYINKSALLCSFLGTTLVIVKSCHNHTVTDSLLRETILYNLDSKKCVTFCSCLFQFGFDNITVAVSYFSASCIVCGFEDFIQNTV